MNTNQLLPATALLKHVLPMYQPIIDVPLRQVVGFEALASCVHPRWLGIAPEVFMPMARRSGVLDDMTVNLCQHVAQDLMALGAIHVNMDFKQLADPALVERVVQAFAPFTMSLAGITFEITSEGESEVDCLSVLQGVERLKALGAQLALEDFGTGHSNFDRLCQLPVDVLKIPRHFVSDLATGHKSLASVKATLALAHSLDLKTIAEGVDNFFQIHALKQMGCVTVQGIWYSRPLSLEAAKAFKREHLIIR